MSDRLNEIKKIIENKNVKCISFDLFDTLVQRPVMNPEDIFTLMGKVIGIDFFKHRRIQAAKRAQLFLDYDRKCVNIDDIYRNYKIMFSSTDEEISELRKLEFELEFKLIHIRNSAKKLYDYALNTGKIVVITSDMYFDSDFLQKVLSKCGIEGYRKLYVSCEQNATKRDGDLYDVIIKDMYGLGINADNILHIGDNKITDYSIPQGKGLKSVFFPAAREVFKSNKNLNKILSWNLPVYETNNNMLIGLVANLYFDDPFIDYSKESYFNGNPKYLGFIVAPFFMNYCIWMQENLKRKNVKNVALAWRDGYMIEKIYDILSSNKDFYKPNFSRLYLSRVIRYPFFSLIKGGLFDESYRLFVGNNTTVKQFINKRLMLSEEDDVDAALAVFTKYGYKSQWQEMGDKEKYIWFMNELEPLFRKGAANQIEIIKKYIEKEIGKEKYDANTVIFDVGYRGSIAKFLEDFFGLNRDTYMIAGTPGSYEEHAEREIYSYVDYGRRNIIRTASFLHMFLEAIICEQVSSAVALKEEDGMILPVYGYDDEVNENINSVQSSICTYVEMFTDIFGEYWKYINPDKHLFFNIITEMLIAPTPVDAELIKGFEISGNILADERTGFSKWFESKIGKETKQ